jgi:undecaprenyl-diphosphatase
MHRWRPLLERATRHPLAAAAAARLEPVTLSAVVLAAGLLFVFARLANVVSNGVTPAFDEWLIVALRTPGNLADPVGPRWLEEMMRDFTALGSTGVLTVLVLAVAGFLAMTRKGHAALLVLLSVAGGVLLSQTMKWAYARPRPDLVPHGAEVFTASFPSGHSMMSAVAYLTSGALLARTQQDRSVKADIHAVAVSLTGLVGVCRG